MKKSHGPALVRSLIPMTECPSCAGKGYINGLLHQLECIGCHSSGFVHNETLEPLLMEDLVVQLGMRLRKVTSQARSLARLSESSESRIYEHNNRRGAGGSNFTGD